MFSNRLPMLLCNSHNIYVYTLTLLFIVEYYFACCILTLFQDLYIFKWYEACKAINTAQEK